MAMAFAPGQVLDGARSTHVEGTLGWRRGQPETLPCLDSISVTYPSACRLRVAGSKERLQGQCLERRDGLACEVMVVYVD